jgi:hypothetical protein
LLGRWPSAACSGGAAGRRSGTVAVPVMRRVELLPGPLLSPAAAVAEPHCCLAMLVPTGGGDAQEGLQGGVPAGHRELGSRIRAPGLGFVGGGRSRFYAMHSVGMEDVVLARGSAARDLAGAGRNRPASEKRCEEAGGVRWGCCVLFVFLCGA